MDYERIKPNKKLGIEGQTQDIKQKILGDCKMKKKTKYP